MHPYPPGPPLQPVERRGRAARALLPLGAATPLLALALFASPVQAQVPASQAIDVQQYKPGPGAYDVLGVHGARVGQHLDWNLGLSVNYADDPLNLLDPRKDAFVYRIVDSQLTVDLMGAIALFDRFELGVSLPVSTTTSQSAGAVSPTLAQGVGTTGVGDLRLVPKVRLLSTDAGLSFALVAPFTLPTSGGDQYLGTGGVTFQPRLVAEWATSAVRLIANAGVNLRGEEQLRNLRVGNEFAYSVGAEVPLTQALTAQASLAGALGLKETHAEERPLEVLGALKYRFTKELAAHVGAGPGLTRGYGTPSFRVLGGLSWTAGAGGRPAAVAATSTLPPPCALGPEDYDGFQDDDNCLDPDDDGDGILDGPDVCPGEKETFNGYQDEDGCPDDPNAHLPSQDGVPPPAPVAMTLPPAPVDTDGDGIIDSEDRCPAEAEDLDGFEDADGCPDPDNDKDGIPDTVDACPLEAETINGVKDEDGCPDEGKSQVRLEGTRIVILEKVYFATSKDVILKKSFNLLTQVASVLKANPQVELVRVEGHTDSQGAEKRNLDLSQRRANKVRDFLMKAGIAGNRLEAVGFGEEKPVDTNKTAKGRENNRRVEFNIVKVTQPTAEGATR
ncbi:OmpA family protein [Myxococcus sp. K15C18031901]|uniref:OmpA family protein n=1 Tax=Myxococcus dinghuensis TaxID=2906761 RepID=UPI0020A7F537|nr:OmpA family protein [Myxococcus dinghuensis]MCP3100814.1 OmpA family protein [Myxococcus dinghuensis]